jgi:hypothetical protein
MGNNFTWAYISFYIEKTWVYPKNCCFSIFACSKIVIDIEGWKASNLSFTLESPEEMPLDAAPQPRPRPQTRSVEPGHHPLSGLPDDSNVGPRLGAISLSYLLCLKFGGKKHAGYMIGLIPLRWTGPGTQLCHPQDSVQGWEKNFRMYTFLDAHKNFTK